VLDLAAAGEPRQPAVLRGPQEGGRASEQPAFAVSRERPLIARLLDRPVEPIVSRAATIKDLQGQNEHVAELLLARHDPGRAAKAVGRAAREGVAYQKCLRRSQASGGAVLRL
jgi:hypothetical protein